MQLLGRGDDAGRESLQQLLKGIEGEVVARGLVQYLQDDPRKQPLWALTLLTDDSLHLVYGEARNTIARILGGGNQEQHALRIPLSDVRDVRIEPPRGFLERLRRGPTRRVAITRFVGPVVRLEIDDSAEELFQVLKRRTSESSSSA